MDHSPNPTKVERKEGREHYSGKKSEWNSWEQAQMKAPCELAGQEPKTESGRLTDEFRPYALIAVEVLSIDEMQLALKPINTVGSRRSVFLTESTSSGDRPVQRQGKCPGLLHRRPSALTHTS